MAKYHLVHHYNSLRLFHEMISERASLNCGRMSFVVPFGVN